MIRYYVLFTDGVNKLQEVSASEYAQYQRDLNNGLGNVDCVVEEADQLSLEEKHD